VWDIVAVVGILNNKWWKKANTILANRGKLIAGEWKYPCGLEKKDHG